MYNEREKRLIESLISQLNFWKSNTFLFFFVVHRLEERLMEKDTVLSTERQESETTKILLSEYQDKNQELLKKIEDAEKNIAHFQDTIQRSVT
jgi:myosin V